MPFFVSISFQLRFSIATPVVMVVVAHWGNANVGTKLRSENISILDIIIFFDTIDERTVIIKYFLIMPNTDV